MHPLAERTRASPGQCTPPPAPCAQNPNSIQTPLKTIVQNGVDFGRYEPRLISGFHTVETMQRILPRITKEEKAHLQRSFVDC